eukprot:NODE_3132_length_825_cov_283.572727.p6 GENE.NODE_3132_length_825_cov_283.572727~~NODE_3132_length_825_cov_283.572727.p6  ORF type:complete len:61 (-),score=5.00 NODE_3132_length_825_cov_283.572727:388-570(-)
MKTTGTCPEATLSSTRLMAMRLAVHENLKADVNAADALCLPVGGQQASAMPSSRSDAITR